MTSRRFVLGGIVIVATLLLAPGGAAAQEFSIFSTFDDDTPGSLPATGGSDQPTGVQNGGVLVQTSANSIATQPLVVTDDSCSASSWYFGGVYYNLPTPVTGGVLRIEATVAANQLTSGIFFEAAVSYFNISVVRLRFREDGTIADQFDVVLSSYAANTPVRFRADIDMDTKTWACTIDDELNGFGDDQVVPGLAFVNNSASITQVGTVGLWLFGSFNVSTCTLPRVVAYDDLLIVTPTPLFVDGFESGDLLAWSDATRESCGFIHGWIDVATHADPSPGCSFDSKTCTMGELTSAFPQDLCTITPDVAPFPMAEFADCGAAGLGPFDLCGPGSVCVEITAGDVQCWDVCAASEAPFGDSPHPDCRRAAATCVDAFSRTDLGLCE